jgi:hypothetical protein
MSEKWLSLKARFFLFGLYYSLNDATIAFYGIKDS